MEKIAFLVFSVLFFACDESVKPVICTAQFVTSEITVQNENSDLISGITIEVKLKETGEILDTCESKQNCEQTVGVYTIFHDGLMNKVGKNGEKVIVSGTKENLTFSQEYIFGKNDCHIFKIAGPDTLIISAQS